VGAAAASILAAALPAGPPAAAFSLIPGEDVTVSTGTLQGSVQRDHREFLGVPFTAPPVGTRRFAAPQPAAAWTGERPARQSRDGCPQNLPFLGTLYPSSEDCPYLDVYTPPAPTPSVVAKKTPVMVWIYGGAYALGDTRQYDTLPFVTRGGVTVEINYRVGRSVSWPCRGWPVRTARPATTACRIRRWP